MLASILRENQSQHFVIPVEYAQSLAAKPYKRSEQAFTVALNSFKKDNIFADPETRAAVRAGVDGNQSELLNRAKTLVQRYPNHHVAYLLLGIAHDECGLFPQAVAAYELATILDPNCAKVWYNLGTTHGRAGQLSKSVAAFHKAVTLEPLCAEGFYHLGVSYSKAQKLNDAITAYENALRLDPDYVSAWFNLCAEYISTGQYRKARRAWERLYKYSPAKAAKLKQYLP